MACALKQLATANWQQKLSPYQVSSDAWAIARRKSKNSTIGGEQELLTCYQRALIFIN
jgi:hypothetical protein